MTLPASDKHSSDHNQTHVPRQNSTDSSKQSAVVLKINNALPDIGQTGVTHGSYRHSLEQDKYDNLYSIYGNGKFGSFFEGFQKQFFILINI